MRGAEVGGCLTESLKGNEGTATTYRRHMEPQQLTLPARVKRCLSKIGLTRML